MFFWNIGLVPFLVIGILWILVAKPIAIFTIKKHPISFLSPVFSQLLIVWMFRILGIIIIAVFFCMSIDRPWMGRMKKAENQLILLESGEIAEGKIIRRWYDDWAPSAWMVLYSFEAPNPANGEVKTYYGSARGPKQYYSSLSAGDNVSILYNPSNPKLNCEMYRFLNYPGYRRTFRQAEKTDLLLMRFKDHYKFETYSYMTWHNAARQK
jgi:hypothetical protein